MTPHLQAILAIITQTGQEPKSFAQNFVQEMELGLAGCGSSLAMYPTFVTLPSGKEQGRYMAVDFGGTQVRVALFELFGQGKFKLLRQSRFQLNSPDKDYRLSHVTGDELFLRLAQEVKTLIRDETAEALGLTFSFPFRQSCLSEAYLTNWTKEIATSNTEGRDIAAMFRHSLNKIGLSIPLTAVINDTVATHLAGSYTDSSTIAGIILGTGHNGSYLEPYHPLTGSSMLVNLECGNFNLLRATPWDEQLDRDSEKPGQQKLEKMVSGCYLEELAVIVLKEWAKANESGLCEALGRRLPCAVMAQLITLPSKEVKKAADLLDDHCGWQGDEETVQGLVQVIQTLLNRSATLAAGTILGILQKQQPIVGQKVRIAVDGSLYRCMPGYAAYLQAILAQEIQQQGVALRTIDDASALGAAIAAAQNIRVV